MCPEYALCDAPSSIWGSVYAAWARACVPLFVMVTGYFVLPVREPTSTFVKKRFSRIIIPFFIWLFVYALYNFLLNKLSLNQFIQALLRIPINYGVDVGHLWYIYMSFGLDLIFPIITPWIRSATKKDFHYLLSIWLSTLFFPYIRILFPTLFGQSYWNNYNTFYYFEGFIGYAVLGQYFRRFHTEKGKWDTVIGLFCILVGGGSTTAITIHLIRSGCNTVDLELPFCFTSINVALITFGIFLLFNNLKAQPSKSMAKIVSKFSEMSFGIYLSHMLIMNTLHPIIQPISLSPGIKIPLLAVSSFFCTFILVWGLSFGKC